MSHTLRKVLASLLCLSGSGVALLTSAEARADIDVEAHVALDLKADPGGLYYVATPPVRIVSPPRITVMLTQGDVVATRVIGMQMVAVGSAPQPVVYVGHHRHAHPIAYVVDHPHWVTGPGVVVVAPSPVVVVQTPGVYVVGPQFGYGRGYGHGHHGGGHKGRR